MIYAVFFCIYAAANLGGGCHQDHTTPTFAVAAECQEWIGLKYPQWMQDNYARNHAGWECMGKPVAIWRPVK